MMASLFFSRAALSISMMTFVAASLFHSAIKKQLLEFFSTPLLWGMSLLFILPLLSGLWSEDQKQWADIIRIKLPLLFLPLAFAGPFRLSNKQGYWLGYIFLALLVAGTCWSMFHYLSNVTEVTKSYLQAKTIVTPFENDHVRFSWIVSVGVLLAGWMFVEKRKDNKLIAYSLALVTVWLIIFLHILAVRTGLFSFYIMVAGLALWLIAQKLNPIAVGWPFGLALMALLVAMPVIAFQTIPTFKTG
jgi:O-antigen ligase